MGKIDEWVFLRHSEILESAGEEQRSVLLSYCLVMIFPVGEGEHVEFQPVLTPRLAVAGRNSCPTHNAVGVSPDVSLRQLLHCLSRL